MATLMQNKGKIIACDIYEHKLKLIQDNANRLGINIIEPKLLDAREIGNQYKNQAEIFEELPPLQLAILESAALAVKPQGVLVYSTCTIMPQENIEIINQFLAKHPEFVLEDIRKYLPFKTKSKEKTLQLMPYKDNTDGFFIARMYKKV